MIHFDYRKMEFGVSLMSSKESNVLSKEGEEEEGEVNFRVVMLSLILPPFYEC